MRYSKVILRLLLSTFASKFALCSVLFVFVIHAFTASSRDAVLFLSPWVALSATRLPSVYLPSRGVLVSASDSENAVVAMYPPDSFSPSFTSVLAERLKSNIHAMCASDDGSRIAVVSLPEFTVYDATDSRFAVVLRHTMVNLSAAMIPSKATFRNRICVCSVDAALQKFKNEDPGVVVVACPSTQLSVAVGFSNRIWWMHSELVDPTNPASAHVHSRKKGRQFPVQYTLPYRPPWTDKLSLTSDLAIEQIDFFAYIRHVYSGELLDIRTLQRTPASARMNEYSQRLRSDLENGLDPSGVANIGPDSKIKTRAWWSPLHSYRDETQASRLLHVPGFPQTYVAVGDRFLVVISQDSAFPSALHITDDIPLPASPIAPPYVLHGRIMIPTARGLFGLHPVKL
eukprot:ANDGO_05068.mRNA.1 hypothetical protein